jgi:uncharacterized protein DUF402
VYPIVRVTKRIPDGSVWQRYRGYRLPDVEGSARVYGPAGTRWWNPLGGWVTADRGISLFRSDRPFVVSWHGPEDAKRFYVDVVRASTIADAGIEYLDLYLDVMVDAAGAVREKDEHQIARLDAAEQAFVRRARDEVRRLIAAGDAMFDPRSPFYAIAADALELPPLDP